MLEGLFSRRYIMKRTSTAILVAALLFLGAPTNVRSDVQVGLSADDSGLREFHLAIGDFYRVPEADVIVVRERHIPDEELPVVFFVAQRARVAPSVIVDLRLGGQSWIDITHYYGLSAEIFYVETEVVSGPPYGRALGYYKNKPRKEWKTIKLGDDDVVNLVNLKFISNHYGYSPSTVIKMRSEGKKFVAINKEAKHGKVSKSDKGNSKAGKANDNSKGKNNSKGKKK
jgi:hypothetical protein